MINVGYKDKIFCGNSVSILKSFYFCAYSGGYPFSISGDIRSVPS